MRPSGVALLDAPRRGGIDAWNDAARRFVVEHGIDEDEARAKLGQLTDQLYAMCAA